MTHSINEGAKKHFLLTIARANQSTSIIRAIVFSISTHHVLFRHLYGIIYIALAVDLGKLFDKSNLNLEKFLKLHETKMHHMEYKKVSGQLSQIKKKHEKTIESIQHARHNMAAHLNTGEANRIYSDPYTEENVLKAHEIKLLLDDIIGLFDSLSILDDEDRIIMKERIGPKDVMDIMGLKIDAEIEKEILKKIVGN